MEIKIQCGCGSKYKFDVEPVNGLVPFQVNCPACGAGGTEVANDYLRQSMPPSAAVPVARILSPLPPEPAPEAVVADTQTAATAPAAPATSAFTPGRLRLNVATHAPAPVPASEASTPVAAAPLTPPPGRTKPAIRELTLDPILDERDNKKFALGLLGAALGVLVGSLIYYLVFSHTGFQIKLLALGVGFLAGLGGKLIGKEGSTELGVIAATLTVAGILSAQYFVAKQWWNEGTKEDAMISSYDYQVAEAKKVMAAIPNETDQEIRLHLAREYADEGEKPDPKSIDKEDIQEFREEDLPRLRDLAGGKLTKEEFDRQQKALRGPAPTEEEKKEDEGTFKAIFLLLTLSRFNIVCIVGAAALAYKMSD